MKSAESLKCLIKKKNSSSNWMEKDQNLDTLCFTQTGFSYRPFHGPSEHRSFPNSFPGHASHTMTQETEETGWWTHF